MQEELMPEAPKGTNTTKTIVKNSLWRITPNRQSCNLLAEHPNKRTNKKQESNKLTDYK